MIEGRIDIDSLILQGKLAIEKRRRMLRAFNNGRIVPAKRPEEKEHKKYLDYMIMVNAYPAEEYHISYARLARAAGELGFYRLTPFAVWRTYRYYGERLSQPLEPLTDANHHNLITKDRTNDR